MDHGLERVEQSLSINPASASALGLRGTLLLLKAEQESESDVKLSLLERGKESLDQALALNSNLSRTLDPPLRKTTRLLSGLDP